VNATTSFGDIIPVTLGVNLVSWLWDVVEATNHGWCMKPEAVTCAMVVPLTRLHDGATISQVSVGFYVNPGRTTLPSIWYPAAMIFRVDPFLGTIERLTASTDWTKFGPAANLAAYKNGGNANKLVFTPDQNNVVDLSRYFYFLALTDEDYN